MVNSRTLSMLLSVLVLAAVQFVPAASARAASPPPSHSRPALVAASPVVFADSISWNGFVRFWRGFVNRADRVILVVGLVAAAALFIITRGRWLK
jgi:hypothetical protein